jgi:serine/threonine protein kinase
MPGSPNEPTESETSLALQIDRASDSFERALRAGQCPDIVEFLTQRGYSPLAPLFFELVSLDIEYRRRTDQSLNEEEYAQRYPGFADQIAAALARTETFGSQADSTGKERRGSEHCNFKIGDSIHVRDTQFDLLQELGEGSFGKVFLARQQPIGRMVALKMSKLGVGESQLLAKLDHPNIVRVYDEVQLPDAWFGLYMEYVPGGSLADVIGELGRRPTQNHDAAMLLEVVERSLRDQGVSIDSHCDSAPDTGWGEVVCALGFQLAGALDYAHQHQTLHRDIKPENILLTSDGTPKLVDFNIAYSALVEDADPDKRFGGSLPYMSPEQLHAASHHAQTAPKDLDGRSDVFSLAVVLWELLTGERPFDDRRSHKPWSLQAAEMAEARQAGVSAKRQHTLERLTLPPGLGDALRRGLEPNREDRYQTAGEFARHLHLCLFPDALGLLKPPAGGLAAWVQRFPFTILLMVALLPSVVLSVCNVPYDWLHIVGELEIWSLSSFLTLIAAVKLFFYGVGVAIGVRWAWPLLTAIWSGAGEDDADRQDLRRRSLYFGDVVFWISFAAWSLSGITIPTSIRVLTGTLGVLDFFHFGAAHVLCGLIAGTSASFPLAYLVSRVFYPRFLREQSIASSEQADIARFQRRLERYVRLTFAVPFVALVALGLAGDNYRLPFIVLTGLALVSLVVEYCLSRATTDNFNALIAALGSRRKHVP